MGEGVKLDVYKIDGSKADEQVTLPQKVFGIEPSDHAVWYAVTAEMANRRQGTANTKNRSAVRGGGRKPWWQKGTGRARVGSIRSPLWVGGGRIFGPSSRSYTKRVSKKMSQLARKSALSYKAKDDKIKVIEDITFEAPKTKQMVDLLKHLHLDATKTLLLTPQLNRIVWLSGRNIPYFSVKEATGFSTYDVMKAEVLLIQRSALKKINEVLVK